MSYWSKSQRESISPIFVTKFEGSENRKKLIFFDIMFPAFQIEYRIRTDDQEWSDLNAILLNQRLQRDKIFGRLHEGKKKHSTKKVIPKQGLDEIRNVLLARLKNLIRTKGFITRKELNLNFKYWKEELGIDISIDALIHFDHGIIKKDFYRCKCHNFFFYDKQSFNKKCFKKIINDTAFYIIWESSHPISPSKIKPLWWEDIRL